MRVELGSRVHSADGQDLGVIRYLILNPANNQVRAAVIEKGFLLTRDVEVPIDAFQMGPEEQLRINTLAANAGDLPPFDLAKYMSPPETVIPIGVAASGILWPTSAAYPTPTMGPPNAPVAVGRAVDIDRTGEDDEQAQIAERVDRENAVISEGSDVISLDGRKVGEVARVDFDAASGRPISIVMRRGFLMLKDVELPAEAIASVDDRVIYLNIEAAAIGAESERITPKAA